MASTHPRPTNRGLHRQGALIVAALVLWANASVRAEPLTKDQQKCAVLMASRLRAVSTARANDGVACFAAAGAGTLGGSVDACIADDQPRPVATAAAKVGMDFDKRCSGTSRKPPGAPRLPPFGVTDAASVNAAASSKELNLFRDVFGADLGAAVIARSVDARGADCQVRTAKALARCQDARVAEFAACAKAGLTSRSDPLDTAADLAGCIGADPKGRVAKRCNLVRGKKRDAIRKTLASCVARGVDPAAAFPGCARADADATHACLDGAVECRACLALVAATGLPRDCDAVDDGLANLSCPRLPAVTSPFTAEVPPFLARVIADRASGVPGTVFNLRVETSGATVVEQRWTGNDGFTAAGESAQVSFTTQGLHPIDVTARDDQGRSVTAGIVLVVFDPGAPGGSVVSSITPPGGQVGTLARLTSPALLDPDAIFSVVIGTAPPVEPFRPELGAANIVIPFTADDGLGGPSGVPVTLLADGVVADTFQFVVSPAPALPRAPGELTRQVLLSLPPLVTELRAALPAELSQAGLTADERGVLLGLLDAALLVSQQGSARALDLLGQLDPAALAAIDQMLVANGIDPGFQAPAGLALHAHSLPALAGETLLQNCCAFHHANDRLQKTMDALRFAAPLAALAALAGGPVSGPLLVGFANAALQLGIVGDIAGLLAKVIPRPDDKLVVSTSTSRIPPTSQERAIIRIKGKLVLDLDLCRAALDGVISELAKALLQKGLPRMPFNTFAREVLRRTMNADLNVRNEATLQVFRDLENFLADVISRLADGIVNVSGMNTVLQNAKVKICDQFQNTEIPIQPASDIVTLSPANIGQLGPYGTDTVEFGCTPGFSGIATVRVVYPCGLDNLTGEVQITCGEETCAEDAAGDLQATALVYNILDQGITMCENTPHPPFHVLTKTMFINFKNLHPSRTIAVSFVIKDTANAPRFDTPPCSGSECDNAVGRCFVFLRPGETSPDVLFDCDATLNSPVVDGTSPCVSGPVMTSEVVIAHATYCDPESPNRPLFCEDVSRFLLETETPHASFTGIRRACD